MPSAWLLYAILFPLTEKQGQKGPHISTVLVALVYSLGHAVKTIRVKV